jgi:LacI family repressor for deo operon, udp, cdd, tsx, nupC, and nupG
MAVVGLPVDRRFILLGQYYARNSEHQPGCTHMRKLLDMPEPPTAVIAGADLLAAGALQAIGERGLSVPGDISIIGYDDTMAEVLTPPLTSIAQPIAELGHMAVILALETVRDPGAPPRSEIFPTHLVIRKSTAVPRPMRNP